MKPKAFVMSCLVVSAMVIAAGSLWAQGAPGDTPPPPPPPGGDGRMAPPPGGPEGGPGPMGPDPAKFDADRDGRVTVPEFSDGFGKALEHRFRELDTNADGSLSLEEFEKAPRPGRGPRGRIQGPGGDFAGPPPPPLGGEPKGQYPPDGMPKGQRPPRRPPFPMPGECDTNKDGVISEAEFLIAHQQAALERFKELDVDGDGNVTLEQLESARGPMGGPRGPQGAPDGSRGPRGPRGGPDGPRGPRGEFGQGGPRP